MYARRLSDEEDGDPPMIARHLLPLDRVALTPAMVQAVLAELLNEHDGCKFDETEVDWHVRTSGYGLVASQLARRAFLSGIEWRAWIHGVLSLFPSGRMATTPGVAAAALRGIIEALLRGDFDLSDENERERLIDKLNDSLELGDEGVVGLALHQTAKAIAWMVYCDDSEAWVAGDARRAAHVRDTITCAAETAAREIVCELTQAEMTEAADAFLAKLRGLAEMAEAHASPGARSKNRTQVPA